MTAIIDYGAGNLRSVQKACEFVGAQADITSDPNAIAAADHVILPGVGAFGDCMNSLRRNGLTDVIHQVTERGTPFLGICLGMQLLFDSSEESPGISGLGIFPGKIIKIPQQEGFKIPHMGWNSLNFRKASPIFAGLPEHPFVYFVHSYYMQPDDPAVIAADTEYCGVLPVALSRGNIFATQFHPEKSGDIGLQILQNFPRTGGSR